MSVLLLSHYQNSTRSLYIKDNTVIDADLSGATSYASDIPFLNRIYWGRVIRVESSHAFVKLSQSHVGILPHEHPFPSLYEGQAILVQIKREAIPDKGTANKGPVLTRKIVIGGRYCLYHPFLEKRFLSSKIIDQTAVKQLQAVFPTHEPITLRELAAQASLNDIQMEFESLKNKYRELSQYSDQTPCSTPYDHMDPIYRWIRDLNSHEDNQICVDNDALYKDVQKFITHNRPDLLSSLKKSKIPLFESYDMEDFWDSLFSDIIALPSGGNIVIDNTTAAIVIDINQGNKDHRETNKEAIPLIVQHLKCRHLGGNIIIDFMGLEETSQKRQYLIDLLNQQAAFYNLPLDIFGWSKLGWLEARLPKRQLPISLSLASLISS
jgi:ribonuclease G